MRAVFYQIDFRNQVYIIWNIAQDILGWSGPKHCLDPEYQGLKLKVQISNESSLI